MLITRHGPLLSNEADFHHKLARTLKSRGLQLVILSYVADTISSLPAAAHIEISVYLPRDAAPVEGPTDSLCYAIRQRFTEWNGSAIRPPDQAEVWFYRIVTAEIVRGLNPALAVLWNGEHCMDLLLRDALDKAGTPQWRLERGFCPGTLHFDSTGILGDSVLGRDISNFLSDDGADYDLIQKTVMTAGPGWYQQPTHQAKDWLPSQAKGKRLILFAEQLEHDTQAFMFSPWFKNSLQAVSWLVDRLPKEKYYLLVKKHPLSPATSASYRTVLADGKGAYIDNVPLDVCLARSDLFVTVNSTTLVEALFSGKIPLALGRSLLTGKGIAYEITDPETGPESLHPWLNQYDLLERLRLWRSLCCFALKQSFTVLHDFAGIGELQTDESLTRLSDRLATACDRSRLPDPSRPDLHAVRLSHEIKNTLMKSRMKNPCHLLWIRALSKFRRWATPA